MSLNLSLVVSGNASGAKDATQQTKSEIGSLRAEAVSASAAMAAANDQAVASSRRVTEALATQAAAERNLRSVIDQRMNIGASTPTLSTPFSNNALRGADIEAYGRSLDALRARFNPIYAAIAQYKTAVMEAQQAERLGAISSDEMTAAIGRQRVATLASIAAIKSRQTAANGNSPRLSGYQLQGLGYQLNDVATMAAMGAPLGQIAASQGGQILQTLQMGEGGLSGSLNAIKGSAAAAGTALLGTLGTVGLIATGFGVAAVAAGAFYLLTREKTKDLNEALKNQRQAILDVANAYDLAKVNADAYNKSGEIFAAAAARKSQSDLGKSAAQEGKDALSQLGSYYTVGRGRETYFGARSEYADFAGPIAILNAGVKAGRPDFDAFAKNVRDVVSQNPGLQQTGDKILAIAAAGHDAAVALKEGADTLARINSRAPSLADAQLGQNYRDQNDAALYWLQQQRAANLQGIGALSPAQRSEAAKAAERARPAPDGESADVTDFRVETAGAIAYAQAIHTITEANEQRRRSIQQTLDAARQDADLVGQSTAVVQAAKMESQQLAQVREEAARNGITSETEFQRVYGQSIALIKQASAEYGKLIALEQARSTIRGQQDDVERQKLEVSLVGAGTLTRQRAIDALKTEQEIRRLGIPLYGAEAEAMRANTAAMSDLAAQSARATLQQQLLFERQQMFRSSIEQTVASTMKSAGLEYDPNSMIAQQIRYNEQLKTTKAAWEDIFNTVNDGIDGISDALFSGGSIEDAIRKAGQQLAKTVFDMSVTNPLKNWLTGGNFNTIADLGVFSSGAWSGKSGGFGGVLGQMLGAQKAVASMQVQAASVFINGSPLGVPGLGGLPGAANDNGGLWGWLKGLFAGSPASTSASNAIAGPNTAATAAKLLSGLGSPLGAPIDSSTTSSIVGQALGFVGNYKSGVDARLTDILNTAAKQFAGFKVDAFSGLRLGDPRFHGQGLATDVKLTDLLSGKALGNYQDASSFGTYEQFAQLARRVQMDKYPELADQFRWGGYFGGGRGKYGAMDEMHFDLGGGRLGMAGGSWANGLTASQRALFPGADSVGSAALDKLQSSATSAAGAIGNLSGASSGALSSLVSSTGTAAKGLDAFGSGAGKLGSMLGQFPAAPTGGGGGGLFSWLGGLFGGGGGSSVLSPAASSLLAAYPFGGGLFAKGAAFQHGNVIPFRNGDVVTTPTYFPMSGGRTGLMGEETEEAIMPLQRGPDGRLGVVNHQPLRAPRAANGNAAGGGSGGLTRAHIRDIVGEVADKLRLTANIINVSPDADFKRYLKSEDGRATVALINRQNG